ncbi:extensin family protein [Rhodoplanes sp. TEM]|uniref:Extensin family protein n=1 Tax=Rhodoplanes tepidamans TaxID=200616 RepID=A0ABT5J7T1_RHOTP|nr:MULTISPECIES: extensin family protein [Rhodoplanes]MDC7785698.1 extensin family protein [Rhodoplanes tepidamans]MDC7983339.1 extensin family protein [Rhodoplanes sp. TEM]MDQ0354734.1 hypothetical protein [Rhodoplanes tepidamans]
MRNSVISAVLLAAAGGMAVAAPGPAGPVPLPRPRPPDAPATVPLVRLPADLLPAGLPVAVPLPRPGPARDSAGLPIPGPPGDPEADAAHAACLARLAGLAEAEPEPPVLGPAGCETRELVRLIAIRLPGGGRVALQAPFQPQTRLRCGMAEAVASWVREDVVAATAALGPPSALVVDSAYECRTRNRVAGAKMSEHGTGNALDVRAVAFASGRTIVLTDHLADKPVRSALAQSVCARFMTVLGPGSDGYHEAHVHVDLAERRNGMRLCKWEVRDASWKPPAKPKPEPAKPDAKADPKADPKAEPEPEPDAVAPDAAPPDAAAAPGPE